jgi:hypothetical protein
MNGPGFLGTLFTHATSKHPAETTPTAKELSEQVFGVHSSTTSTTFKTFLSILIVDLTFLRIRQNFIGVGEFLEFFSSIRVRSIFVYNANIKLADGW